MPLLKLFPILLLTLVFSCESALPTDLTKAALIPYPALVAPSGERFVLNEYTVLDIGQESEEVIALGKYLQSKIEEITALKLKTSMDDDSPANNFIVLRAAKERNPDISPEFYNMDITADKVEVFAEAPAGIFRAIHTLLQLIPGEALGDEQMTWDIPTGGIIDEPAFAYRGAMLDVSRHFFGVEDVKRFIDLIALCKINYLHLHLADDQGWRIEIKSWPNLAVHGGSTQVGGGAGGFYTQEEYRDLVNYAASRYITIVPEIDMPGHTNAALASYPELNCDGLSPALYTGTEVGFSTLCTSKEVVYQFVDDVVRELAALTPGPYIHIGGDESHVTALEDYIPFIERVQTIVAKHGKQIIGWDEISHANLTEGAVVQYWADAENAQRGVSKGAKVLLSPAHKVYLDMQYDSTTALGLHWAAYIELDSAYLWSPEKLVEGVRPSSILGIESPLWSETITNMDEIEYMVFPRLLAHAELGWSPAEVRNWAEFSDRLVRYAPHLEAMGVDFYKSPMVEWTEETTLKD